MGFKATAMSQWDDGVDNEYTVCFLNLAGSPFAISRTTMINTLHLNNMTASKPLSHVNQSFTSLE